MLVNVIRHYVCINFGFEYHKDEVGAINIMQKQTIQEFVPEVDAMTMP